MCYEGECRHKKPKPIIRPRANIEVLDREPWWDITSKNPFDKIILNTPKLQSIKAKHFIRRTDNKLMFFTGRKDIVFMYLNMAMSLTAKQANCLKEAFELIDIPCEIITLSALKKELRSK